MWAEKRNAFVEIGGDFMSRLNIRQLELGPLQANAYILWLEGREDCLVIDPGDDIEGLEAALREIGVRPTDVLLTHGHFDHILGVAHLKEAYSARVHIHPNDAHMLVHPGKALYISAWCNLPFTPVEADALLPEGDEDWRIELCGIPFTGFRTPGHTPGCVCLLNEENKVLFTGDTLFAQSYGRTDFPGGSDADMRQSLMRLLRMDRSLTVYSGHGEADTLENIACRWKL